jgi:DNA-binding CsgD family transcriptional regulator
MILTRSDETELLPPLHEGMYERPLWKTFLDRFRGRTRADAVSLIFRQGRAPIHQATELHAGRDLRAMARELGEIAAPDPIPYDALRPGRVYSAEEMIDPQDPQHDRFRGYLQQLGVRYGRFMRVAEPGGTSAWLTMAREHVDLRAADSALMAALAPHLAIALRHFATFERERFRAQVAEAALARTGIGWAALDAEAQLVDANPAGAARLRAPGRPKALFEAAAAFASDPTAAPRAVRMGGEPAADLLAVAVSGQPLAAFAMPVMVALARDPVPRSADHATLFAQSYGLTTSEGRLALLLAAGRSLAEAAVELGLTLETARNYSKRLYGKTGTRGQPDLVRLVLRSVAMLG